MIQALKRYTNLSQFILRLLQHPLLLGQSGLSSQQPLTLGLDDAVHPAVHLHGAHPHAQRARSQRHTAHDLRLEVRLRAVLRDLLQDAVADVVLVKVHQLLDEGTLT